MKALRTRISTLGASSPVVAVPGIMLWSIRVGPVCSSSNFEKASGINLALARQKLAKREAIPVVRFLVI
jgi:hypothetical protein